MEKLLAIARELPEGEDYYNLWRMLQRYKGNDRSLLRQRRYVQDFLDGKLDSLNHERFTSSLHIPPANYQSELINYRNGVEPSSWDGQQAVALKRIHRWFFGTDDPRFILYGVAGSGKTYLASEVYGWDPDIVGVAFTGMAALNLASRGIKSQTIHSLIYKPVQNMDSGEMTYVLKAPSDINLKLIICDEIAMVDEALGNDLASLGIRLLCLGDPYQLQPVDGKPWLPPSLTPDYMLDEPRRQALDNPIIWLSQQVRHGKSIKLGDYGETIVRPDSWLTQDRLSDLLIENTVDSNRSIVGRNDTRESYNRRVRRIRNYEGKFPHVGETLICLKNEKFRGLVNGQLWSVEAVTGPLVHTCSYYKFDPLIGELVERTSRWNSGEPGEEGKPVTVNVLRVKLREFASGTIVECNIPVECFEGRLEHLHWKQKASVSLFTYGYILTAHKAQGSTFFNTFVRDESWCFREYAMNHLYSSITRASNKLVLVKS